MIAQRFDVFANLRAGGTVMINTSLTPDEAFASLPKDAQEHLIRLRANLYFLDANAAANAIIASFTDHNHYHDPVTSLMLEGYTASNGTHYQGIIDRLVPILSADAQDDENWIYDYETL